MKITLKDGSVKEYAGSKSIIDIAFDISEGLARAACAGEVDGEVLDLRTVIDHDCSLNILTAKDEAGLRVVRHTCSHISSICFPKERIGRCRPGYCGLTKMMISGYCLPPPDLIPSAPSPLNL